MRPQFQPEGHGVRDRSLDLSRAVPRRVPPLRSHVELGPECSGLDLTSYARCDHLRVVSVERLSLRRGMVGPDRMRAIDQALRFVLDL